MAEDGDSWEACPCCHSHAPAVQRAVPGLQQCPGEQRCLLSGVPPHQAAIPRGPVHRDEPRGKAAWKPSFLVLLPSAWQGD